MCVPTACRITKTVNLREVYKIFHVRTYGVQELAMLYFPDVQPASASRHLVRLLRGDSDLLEQIEALGYRRGCRTLTPAMVTLVVHYLGVPQHYSMEDVFVD